MSILRRKRDRRDQHGFTLVEFAVALAISAVVLVGSVAIMRYIIVATAENGDRTIAQLQVHYISSWLVDDVVQAERIHFGNSTGTGFPIIINDGAVTYDVVENMGENPWQLTRTVEADGGNQTLVVAEYLVPWSEENQEGTICYQKSVDGAPVDVLVLEVTAKVDQREESGSYEISPRASDIVWEFGE